MVINRGSLWTTARLVAIPILIRKLGSLSYLFSLLITDEPHLSITENLQLLLMAQQVAELEQAVTWGAHRITTELVDLIVLGCRELLKDCTSTSLAATASRRCVSVSTWCIDRIRRNGDSSVSIRFSGVSLWLRFHLKHAWKRQLLIKMLVRRGSFD